MRGFAFEKFQPKKFCSIFSFLRNFFLKEKNFSQKKYKRSRRKKQGKIGKDGQNPNIPSELCFKLIMEKTFSHQIPAQPFIMKIVRYFFSRINLKDRTIQIFLFWLHKNLS